MGGKGEGPGEFRIGRYIWVLPGDTLWVGDYRPWRYHVYASSGEYVRTVDMKPQYFNASLGGGVLDNGISVNVRDLDEPRDLDFRVHAPWFVEAHAADGSVVGELARLEAEREGTWEGAGGVMNMLFDPRPSLHARGTTIAIAAAREPEVRLLDEQLRLSRIVRRADPDRKVTRAHVEAQCRLDHPAGVTIYEFGAAYLLGVHSDELGVERIVMYELMLPEPGAG